MSKLVKIIRDPKLRFKGAVVLFFISVAGGIISTVWIAKDPYERVLMAISWGAITITALDLIATTDVRKENDK